MRPRQPASPTALVPALLRYVASRGGDAAALASRFELPADAAGRDELAVPPAAIDELLDAAARELAEPALALRLPAELPLRRYGLGELAARASSTLRDALAHLARAATELHPLIALALAIEGEGDGALAAWHQSTPTCPRGLGRHADSYALAYAVTRARDWLGEPLPIARAWFAHPRPRDLGAIERWFGTDELAFGALDSGVAFPAALLDRALVTADPRLLATVATLASASPPVAAPTARLAPRVIAALRAALPSPPAAADVAAALHMSARTLQRRLESEGTSFTALVDDTREALARDLLRAEPAPALADIAERLGFADLATFSRAFKRWTGTSPGRYRYRGN